jgi:MFS family permease
MSIWARLRAASVGLPRIYWWLWTGTLVNRMATFVVPFLSLYLTQERHLSVVQAGLMLSLFGAGGVAAGLIGGVLADRLGRRPTMLLSLLGSGVGTIALGFIQPIAGITVMVFALGFIGECYRPAVSATVADVVPPADRARAYGYIYWAVNLGFAIGLVLAGFLVKLGYGVLFLCDGLTSLTFAMFVWRAVPETGVRNTRAEHPLRGTAIALTDWNLVAFVSLTFLFGCLMFQSAITMPLDWTRHGVTAQQYGLLSALNCILVVVLQPIAAAVLKRYRRANVLSVSGVLMAIGFGLNGFVSTIPMFALGVAIWTLGEVAAAPIAPSVIADLAPAEYRGRYQGIFSMSFGLANFAGPAMGSLVLERAGSRPLWLSCVAVGITIAIGHLAIAPARRRTLALRGAPLAEEPALGR